MLAFLFTAGHSSRRSGSGAAQSSGPLPAVSVAPPPAPTAAISAGCTKIFTKLPVKLGQLDPRATDTDSSFVVAWGDPAIVLRCGVPKPAALNSPTAAQLVDVDGVLWQPVLGKRQAVYTTVDRAVYVEVSVPAGADQPLPLLAGAIKSLPQLCTATDAAGNQTDSKLPVCS